MAKYKPIVLYIKSSSNGKASDKTINDITAFLFHIDLCTIAMNLKDIDYYNRHLFFDVALWFLVYYKMKFEKCQTKSLNERKYKEKIDVYAYSNELLIEFTNCIFSNIDLINK